MRKYARFMTACILITALFSVLSPVGFASAGLAAESAATQGEMTVDLPLALPVGQTSADSAVVLMYHHLVPDELYVSGRYDGNNAVIPVSEFDAQMKYLQQNGYTTLTMSELMTYLRNDLPLPARSVAVTFDDGYESNYVYAYPILQKYGLKATIAVVVSGSENLTEHEYNPSSQSHLTFGQMREMVASGLVEIGSHSYDGHSLIKTADSTTGRFFTDRLYLSALGRSETRDEYIARINDDLRRSKYILEQEVGAAVNYFAFPYGVSNSDAICALKNIGFGIAVTVRSGRVDADDNIFTLNRKNVNPGISIDEYAVLIDN